MVQNTPNVTSTTFNKHAWRFALQSSIELFCLVPDPYLLTQFVFCPDPKLLALYKFTLMLIVDPDTDLRKKYKISLNFSLIYLLF